MTTAVTKERLMAYEPIDNTQKLTAADVTEVLETYVGTTGTAKIQKGDLLIKAEENASDWSYCETVEDVNEAETAIGEYFNR